MPQALNISALQKFLARYPDTDTIEHDPRAPRTIFPTAYELTREQEDNLMSECYRRLCSLKTDLGWDLSRKAHWWRADGVALDVLESPVHTFFGKRDLYTMMFRGQVDWRPYVYPGLFRQSNLHMPLIRHHTQMMASRMKNYFFGSEPWMAYLGKVGTADEIKAKASQKVHDEQFRKADAVTALSGAVNGAFERGETIVKPLWRDWRRYFRQFAEVATWNRKPVLLPNDDYIYRDDQWARQPNGMEMLVRPDLAEPFMITTDELMQIQWQRMPVLRERTVYRGLELFAPYYKDILVTPTAPTLARARDIVHLFDEARSSIATRFLSHLARNGMMNEFVNVLRLLRNLSPHHDFHSGEGRPRPELSEFGGMIGTPDTQFESSGMENCQFAEHTLDVDVDEDGYSERVVVLYDVETRYPISYDYLDNVSPQGHEAFSCIRINPEPNRWHGTGQVEIFWKLQEAFDLFLNRINKAVSEEGALNLIRGDAILNKEADNSISLNGDVNAIEMDPAGPSLNEAFRRIYLNENIRIDHLWQLVQFLHQGFVALAGQMGLDSAEAADLNATETATGIRQLTNDRNETFRPLIGDVRPGVQEIALMSAAMIDANIDEGEVRKFLEDDLPTLKLYLAQRNQDFGWDIDIVLTKYQKEQELAQLQAGIAACKDYVAQMPPVRMVLGELYVKLLELFEQKNAREIIGILAKIPPMMSPDLQVNPQAVQPQPKVETI